MNNIQVINLLRRTDRKEKVTQKLKNANINNYDFFEAIDGHNLIPTYEIAKLFKGNDFHNRKGVIGAALSHYTLWKKLLESDLEYFLIMEDDLNISENFKDEIDKIDFSKYDFLFFGYHMFQKNYEKVKDKYQNNNPTSIHPLDVNLYIGGFHCYSISRNGAQKMIDYIAINNIKHGIDYYMKIMPNLQCWETQPMLSVAEWNEWAQEIDSDIQNLYDGIDFSEFIENKDKFIFFPQKDQMNYDLYCKKNNIEKTLELALNDPNCVAVNTLGFFKSKITSLTTSPYFSQKDGIYIKKDAYEISQKKQIKMLCNWCSSEQLCKEWSNMCENKFYWKNLNLTWENENIDYYVIVNYPCDNSYYDPKKTIVFQMEPWVYDKNKNWGVKTWGQWAEPDENKFMHVHSHKKYLNNVQWLFDIPKNIPENRQNKIISILSLKNFDDGHVKRINLIKYLEDNNSNFIDIYGRKNYHNLKNYKGTTEDNNKYKDYKYCLNVENNSEYNYATEKIWEPILSEMLCFYWGCPNLEEHIDSNAFVRLDMDNFEESLKIIQKAIEEDWWSQRIDSIRKMKEKILNELAFFPTLEKIIN